MRALVLLPLLSMLTACNWVMNVSGLATEANKAIGASCRQTGRSLEECYSRNPDADKGQVFNGWREMNEYMTKNKLDTLPPMPDPAPVTEPAHAESSAAGDHGSAEAQKKTEHAAEAPPVSKLITPAVKGPMTAEEAEQWVKNDPETEAILSTLRRNEKAAEKPTGPSPTEKRLLGIINDSKAPEPPAAAAATEDSFGKPAAMPKK